MIIGEIMSIIIKATKESALEWYEYDDDSYATEKDNWRIKFNTYHGKHTLKISIINKGNMCRWIKVDTGAGNDLLYEIGKNRGRLINNFLAEIMEDSKK